MSKCWWCIADLSSDNPFRIPISHEKNEFKVIGQCCSLNCCMAYILNGSNVSNPSTSICLLYKLYSVFIKKNNIKNIVPSPPREVLRIFGGDICYEEYNKIKNLNSANIITPPIVPVKPQITYFINTSALKTSSKNTLVLKRSKPLTSKHVSIEKTLGIIRTTQ